MIHIATLAELREACKIGLNISVDGTNFDSMLDQKISMVVGYMKNAGVTDAVMATDQAIGTLVMGVSDTWNLNAGEIKFSTVFHTLLTQLAAIGSVLTVTTSPIDGATGVVVSVTPVLTFSARLGSYSVAMKEHDNQVDIAITVALDITEMTITVTPSSDLATGTKYAIIIEATSTDGPSLARTVISFTTI